jgi:hypothetical protein
MSQFQLGWSRTVAAIGVIATQHGHLRDAIDIETNRHLERAEVLEELGALAKSGEHLSLPVTLTFTRRGTGACLGLVVGLADCPPTQGQGELLAWQYGMWSGLSPEPLAISPVLALAPSNAELIVLESLGPMVRAAVSDFIRESGLTSKAFISYVHEDSDAVDSLCEELHELGIDTWRDRQDLDPGVRWKDEIRTAIQDGAAFIACFSPSYHARSKTYMQEELLIAIDELRQRPRHRAWFFPIVLDHAKVPPIPIGAGETLQDLQSVSLVDGGLDAIKRLAQTVRRAHQAEAAAVETPFDDRERH